jgi:hypothetical protein
MNDRVSRIFGAKGTKVPAPTAAEPAARKRISNEAAHFAQGIRDLEEGMEAAEQALRDSERRAERAEDAVSRLNDELNRCKAELDYFKNKCIAIQANLHTAGSIILNALKEPGAEHKPDPLAKAMRNVEEIIKQPPQIVEQHEQEPEIPAYLKQGPSRDEVE